MWGCPLPPLYALLPAVEVGNRVRGQERRPLGIPVPFLLLSIIQACGYEGVSQSSSRCSTRRFGLPLDSTCESAGDSGGGGHEGVSRKADAVSENMCTPLARLQL